MRGKRGRHSFFMNFEYRKLPTIERPSDSKYFEL